MGAQQAAEPTEVWAWLFSELLLQPLRKRRLCPHLAKLISELRGQESFSRAGPCLEVGGKQGQLSPLTLTTAPDKAGGGPCFPRGRCTAQPPGPGLSWRLAGVKRGSVKRCRNSQASLQCPTCDCAMPALFSRCFHLHHSGARWGPILQPGVCCESIRFLGRFSCESRLAPLAMLRGHLTDQGRGRLSVKSTSS